VIYATPYFSATLDQSWVGSDYVAEVGYVRRKAYLETTPGLTYTFFPAGSKILSHGPIARFDIILNPDLKMTDRQTQLGYRIGWRNRNEISLEVSEQYVKLSRSFDPTNTGGEKLGTGSAFNWKRANVSFISDTRRLFSYTANGGFGGYYNGTRLTLGTSFNFRVQPFGSISIMGSYNDISLPEPYSSARLYLIGPKIDLTLTDKIFITTFVQYNDQIDNINLNVRFQWRFAPVSDVFIVYTGNSQTGNFVNKNRGLAVKVSYWFN